MYIFLILAEVSNYFHASCMGTETKNNNKKTPLV